MQPQKLSYQIRLEGYVTLDWSAFFEKVEILHTQDRQTVLIGEVPDQTALHGILMQIRDLGLSLLEVKRIKQPK